MSRLKCKLFGEIKNNKRAALFAILLFSCISMSGCSYTVSVDNTLFRAIDYRNVELVKEAASKSDLDKAVGRNGRTTTSSLIYAMSSEWESRANRGPTDIFKILLDAGANVNERLAGGDTPCFRAVALDDEAGIRYMELMLEYGADLSLKNDKGDTVLDEAVKCGKDKTALYLIQKGAIPTENTVRMLFNGYIDSRDGRCAYALLRSLLSDYGLTCHEIPETVRAAVLGEVPPSEEIAELSEDDRTWLTCCVAAFGTPETLETLYDPEDVKNIFDAEEQSLLEISAQTGNQRMLAYLLKEIDCDPFLWRGLLSAVEAHQTACAGQLLERVTPEHLQALSRPEWEVEWLWRKALLHDDPNLLTLLYDHSLLPTGNDMGDGLYNCINDSIEENRQASLAFLLEHFAVTPGIYLDTACRYQNVEAAQLLIERGVTREDAEYALPFAAANGSAEIVRLLLALGADPNIQEPTYGSPLLGAARFGYLEVVSLLLDQGADPKQVYWDDKDNILIEVAFGSNRILGQLIEAGAEINYQNAEGRTPLHYAVLNNRPENVRTLLEEGAYPNVVDSDGNTALDLAEQEELREIISILEEYNATVK